MRHFTQSTTALSQQRCHSPLGNWKRQCATLEKEDMGKEAQFLIMRLFLCIIKKPNGNRALAKIQTSPPFSRSFSRKREMCANVSRPPGSWRNQWAGHEDSFNYRMIFSHGTLQCDVKTCPKGPGKYKAQNWGWASMGGAPLCL